MELKIADNFALPLEFVTGTEAILGRKGSGKSHTASVMAEELLEAGQQIIVIDPTDVWWGLRARPGSDLRDKTGAATSYPVAVFGGDHADVPLEPGQGKEVAAALVESGSSAILSTGDFGNAEACRFIADFLNELFRLKGRGQAAPLKLIVDEADAFAPQRPNGEEMKALGAMQKIIRRGRSRGIGCLMITQRPQEMSKGCLSQADMLVLMRLSHPKDIAAVDEWVRVNAEPHLADQVEKQLPALPVGKGILWHPEQGLLTHVQFRRRRTFDSGATPKVNEVRAKPGEFKPIDLEKLGASVKRAVEARKANDPEELRKKIAQLEAATPNSEDRGYAAGYDEGYAAARREKEGWLEPAEVDNARAEAHAQGVRAMAARVKDRVRAKLTEIADDFARIGEGVLWPAEAQNTASLSFGRVLPPEIDDLAAETQSPPVAQIRKELEREGVRFDVAHPPTFGKSEMPRMVHKFHTKGIHAILQACRASANGCTRAQLTLLTGYKRSTRDAYIARGAAAGWLAVGERITLTAAGVKECGPAQPVLRGRALLERYVETLPEGESKVLAALAQAGHGGATREVIGNATGYKRSTRDAYISRLATRELVQTEDGKVKLAELLLKG